MHIDDHVCSSCLHVEAFTRALERSMLNFNRFKTACMHDERLHRRACTPNGNSSLVRRVICPKNIGIGLGLGLGLELRLGFVLGLGLG